MKITGLITEYNPFHSGHLYHINKAKEVTGADYCIALMSGSFVQRGAPAVYDKYVRTAMALEGGADLVLEMPVAFSTASAMEFASYGIALFTALGAVTSVCFGSECGTVEPLRQIASLLNEESSEFKEALKLHLKNGLTYPKARNQALLTSLRPEEQELLLSPNNILGIEYIRAGLQQQSPLSFSTVKREGCSYHDQNLPSQAAFPSASAIRLALESGIESSSLKDLIPDSALKHLRGEIPVFQNDFSSLLNYRILSGNWSNIEDLTPELEQRLKKTALPPASFTERIQALKSRQLTYTRCSRALLHLLLDIHAPDVDSFKKAGYAPYARILGFRKEAAPLLKSLKESSSIPLLTKLADASTFLPPASLPMLEQEIKAAHLYQTVKQAKGGTFTNEYTKGIIIHST